MKKTWIALIILGLFFSTINSIAQDYQKADKIEISKPGKAVTFNKTTHDFGVLEKGAPATAAFTIKNNKTEPLIIVHVGASCGCTAPAYPKEPIAPGKTGVIKLTYDSKRLGPFKKSAQVKTKDGKFFKLFIEGTVEKSEGQESKK